MDVRRMRIALLAVIITAGVGSWGVLLASPEELSETQAAAVASSWPPVLTLGAVRAAATGARIDGKAAGDRAGWEVRGVGDVNGDGIDDFAIGAPNATSTAGPVTGGSVYVVYGKKNWAYVRSLANFRVGEEGLRFDGGDQKVGLAGFSTSVGDINGDGRTDFVISAPYSAPNGRVNTGSVFVALGPADGWKETVNLSSLDGINGFRLDGAIDGGRFGFSAIAADVNADGFDDVVSCAPGSSTSPVIVGLCYVYFGRAGGFDAALSVDAIGERGAILSGIRAGDLTGFSLRAIGDFNRDGVCCDIAVGAPLAMAKGFATGEVYVLYASKQLPAALNFGNLNGTNGFTVIGAEYQSRHGWDIGAGDVNGDGRTDLIVGAVDANSNGVRHAGAVFPVFSTRSAPARLDLANCTGTRCARVSGVLWQTEMWKVDAGDFNGDGIEDIITGAPFDCHTDGQCPCPEGGRTCGFKPHYAYVIFGRTSWPKETLVSDLNGSNGFRINGSAPGSLFGRSVADLGDVNGDGVDDFAVGAYNNDPGVQAIRPDAGSTYIFFGHR